MNTKIFLYPFQLSPRYLQCIPTSYIEGKQKYLFFVLEYSIKFENKIPVTYLLVPDDNSVFVNYLKKNGIDVDDAKAEEQLNNCFSTNLDNLKFKPDFIVGKTAYQGKCFLVEKRNKTPLTPITFQVNRSTKVRLDKLFPGGGYKNSAGYAYELEIEPLSLGIEGMSPIARIVFVLFEKYAKKKGAMENFQEKYEKLISNSGLHEVGKNCYIIEKNEDLIIIDCGIKFLNNGYNLANGIIPNFAYLKNNKERIKGLFITHGHEDHIGGIPYLLAEIGYNFPVYGSAFALALLKGKLGSKENSLKGIIFSDDTTARTAEFRISFFRVTHSIPGSFGLIVETSQVGKKGVDLLLSDSTNAEVPGTTPTERKIVSRLEVIISQAPGRVIVTSFASNVYRLKKIIEIAKKYDKKILLLGSSLAKMMKGEAKAVLSRLAHQIHPDWKIVRGDTVILTSSPIMDNRYNLEAINNKLMELGASIYENSKEELLHASGHACQEDLKLMLTLVKPRYFMPFHGDFRMLKVHGALAQETGVPAANVFVCQNGEVIQAREEETEAPKFFFTNQKVDATPHYVFNQKIIHVQQKFELPYLFTYGFLNMEKNKILVHNWKKTLHKLVNDEKKLSLTELKKKIKEKMENLLSQDLPQNKPLIISIVEGYKVESSKAESEKRPNVLLFIIGLKKEKTAIREAKRLNIPIMAICNTSADPDLVDYVIPVNAVAEVIRESKLRKDAELTAEESKSPEEAKNLHIGHLFTILQTIRFAQKGFKILLVFGGATSKIGDPSDKLKERPQLADDEIKNYYQKIEGQITDLLLKEKKPCQPGFRPLELFYSDNPVLLKDIYQVLELNENEPWKKYLQYI
ncbi:6859_t:CDS:2 [Entrophospora sp. SA101]|nr:6859_t:CDS:2 [Entrophospora sp. SA101]